MAAIVGLRRPYDRPVLNGLWLGFFLTAAVAALGRWLVGGDATLARPFLGGHFATLYLSPKDYHRIHMPCAGRLVRMLHVPGELFSVNPTTARGVPAGATIPQ